MNLNIKYRPKTINECYISDENKKKLNRMIEKESFRNMIFYGDVGTGKSTVIDIILKSNQFKKTKIIKINLLLDKYKKIMASLINDEYNEWKSKGYNVLILLENLDLIETKTRVQLNINVFLNNITDNSLIFFIESNNIINIDKSVQNHTINMLFNTLDYNHYNKYIKSICNKENIKINNDIIEKLFIITNGDIRNTLNQLTALYLCNKNITLDLFETVFNLPSSTVINNIIKNIINKENYDNIINNCNLLYDNKFSCNEILLNIFNMIYNYNIEIDKKMLLLEKLGKNIYKVSKYSNNNIDDLIKVINKLYNIDYNLNN